MKSPLKTLFSAAPICLIITLFQQPDGMAAEAVIRPNRTSAFLLVLDHSLSMTNSDPRKMRLDAATLVVDAARPGDRLAVVVFARDAKVLTPLTLIDDRQKQELSQKIHGRPGVDGHGTDIIAALDAVRPLVHECLLAGAQPAIILLTDGKMEAYNRNYTGPKYPDEKKALNEVLGPILTNPTPIHCIALTKEADTGFLREIATITEGGYFTINSGDDLLPVYLQILSAGRGMAATESEQFFVWPKAAEVNLVLFKNEPSSRIDSITADTTPVRPSDSGTYWSRTRPKYYEFVRVLSPRSGNWQVALERKSARDKVHIYALQSLPFDFRVIAPKGGGKEVMGTEVRFAAELLAKAGARMPESDPLLSQTGVKVELIDPDNTKTVFDLASHKGEFTASRRLESKGDFLADFVASFRPVETTIWTLKVRRIFRTGPPDFEIVLSEPADPCSLESPLVPLQIRYDFKKLDPLCPLNSPPTNTVLRAEFRKDSVAVGQTTTWTAAEQGPKLILDAREPALEPGAYQLGVWATHRDCTVKPAERKVLIGPWPEPGDLGLSDRVVRMPDSPESVVGQVPQFRASLINKAGKPVQLGDRLNEQWRLDAVRFELELKDRLGASSFGRGTQWTNDPSGPRSTAFDFDGIRIRASGSNRVCGKRHLTVGLIVAGRPRTTQQVTQPLTTLDFQVPPVEAVEIDPKQIGFTESLNPGTRRSPVPGLSSAIPERQQSNCWRK